MPEFARTRSIFPLVKSLFPARAEIRTEIGLTDARKARSVATMTETRTPTAAAILAHYRPDVAAQREAREWYALAQTEARRLARKHRTTRARAAGTIAALSPLQTWAGNVSAADRVLAAAAAGEPEAPRVGLGANVAKAWRIAQGERPLDVLSGPKVRSFYRNIMGDLSAVTVDRWAARACGVPESFPRGAKNYAQCEHAYREAATTLGIAPAILQAIVWCSIRGRAS